MQNIVMFLIFGIIIPVLTCIFMGVQLYSFEKNTGKDVKTLKEQMKNLQDQIQRLEINIRLNIKENINEFYEFKYETKFEMEKITKRIFTDK